MGYDIHIKIRGRKRAESLRINRRELPTLEAARDFVSLLEVHLFSIEIIDTSGKIIEEY